MSRHPQKHDKSEDQPPTKRLVISYVPLMDYTSIATDTTDIRLDSEPFKKLASSLDAYRNHGYGCLWTLDQETGKVTPVLIMDEAERLVQHMTAWAEGKPQDWFTVYACTIEEGYAIVIMPNLLKGAERLKTNYMAIRGEFMPPCTFTFLFKPLLIAVKGGMFHQVKDILSSSIGFVDNEAVRHDKPDNPVDRDSIVYLHNITYGDPREVESYTKDLLREEKEGT